VFLCVFTSRKHFQIQVSVICFSFIFMVNVLLGIKFYSIFLFDYFSVLVNCFPFSIWTNIDEVIVALLLVKVRTQPSHFVHLATIT